MSETEDVYGYPLPRAQVVAWEEASALVRAGARIQASRIPNQQLKATVMRSSLP